MVTNPIKTMCFLPAFPSTPTNMNVNPKIKCQDWIDIYRCLHCGKIVERVTLLLSNLCIMPPIHSPSKLPASFFSITEQVSQECMLTQRVSSVFTRCLCERESKGERGRISLGGKAVLKRRKTKKEKQLWESWFTTVIFRRWSCW